MAELALQGVSKTYSGHVAAVQDLDLTIQDQELVVLVGPSGCGKTTTLRLIAGLDDLSHGVIRIDGQPVNQVAPRDRNIAMVFQHSALYPHLSVYDNIAFGLQDATWCKLGSKMVDADSTPAERLPAPWAASDRPGGPTGFPDFGT